MGKPAGNSRATALIAHKSTDLDAWTQVISTVTNELAVDSNFSSMSFEYNTDNTIDYIDVSKSINGNTETIRLSFSYTAEGLISGLTKALQ